MGWFEKTTLFLYGNFMNKLTGLVMSFAGVLLFVLVQKYYVFQYSYTCTYTTPSQMRVSLYDPLIYETVALMEDAQKGYKNTIHNIPPMREGASKRWTPGSTKERPTIHLYNNVLSHGKLRLAHYTGEDENFRYYQGKAVPEDAPLGVPETCWEETDEVYMSSTVNCGIGTVTIEKSTNKIRGLSERKDYAEAWRGWDCSVEKTLVQWLDWIIKKIS